MSVLEFISWPIRKDPSAYSFMTVKLQQIILLATVLMVHFDYREKISRRTRRGRREHASKASA